MTASSENKYRGSVAYHLVYCALINAARSRGTVTYQEIAEFMGLPMSGSHMGRETGAMLGTISEDEVAKGRPMLSAIAVGVSGKPGDGFYWYARELGRFDGDTKQVEESFWETEKRAVYEAWQREFTVG